MTARAPSIIIFIMLASTTSLRAEVGSSQLGFGYCSPPIVPSCIAETATRRSSRPTLDACSREVLRFTQWLGAYRACLDRESMRAIGSGNAAIARFRCISQGGRHCP